MKIFVTGGSGFIATPVVKHLLEKGYKVKVLDIREPKIRHKNLEFVRKSILDSITSDIEGTDAVFHFAALLGVDNSDKRPLDTMKINLEGSVNVFRCALEAGIKRIIYSSSSEVYGEPRELPIKEESVKGPVSTYGVSKLASEIYARAFNYELGADIKIVRFFNVYGPGQENNWVVPIFLNKALRNEPITVLVKETRQDALHMSRMLQRVFWLHLKKVGKERHTISEITSQPQYLNWLKLQKKSRKANLKSQN